MDNYFFHKSLFSSTENFEQIIIVDGCYLSAEALRAFSLEYIKVSFFKRLSYFSELPLALSEIPERKVLLIIEMYTEKENFTEGLKWLSQLAKYRSLGLKLLVFTGISEPLLLRSIISCSPSAIVMRSEKIEELDYSIHCSGKPCPGVHLSQGVTEILLNNKEIHLTIREIQWLHTQIDGFDLCSSAAFLGISYKTAASIRRNVIKRLGCNSNTLAQWISGMREQTGAGLRGWKLIEKN
ncbi:response regulator transcription factor [Pantoea ananatis]|uniref:response regulator transcription factor n=1 Tax=Pantoea ananas TaxID=553 RepID=UPI000F886E04|nr:response regulator transcription factor [Pantoea ananatis]RQN05294.1 DNA-binding response regulator [Pantoea ananatis]